MILKCYLKKISHLLVIKSSCNTNLQNNSIARGGAKKSSKESIFEVALFGSDFTNLRQTRQITRIILGYRLYWEINNNLIGYLQKPNSQS